jgi:hypothetical protein
VANGDLSRWPLGFSFLGVQPSLTRTTAAEERRFNRYGVKVEGNLASGPFTRAMLAVPVPDTAQYVGQPVTIWADVKRISGAEISLGIFEGTVGQFRWFSHVASTETGWVRLAMTYYPITVNEPPVPESWVIVLGPLDNQEYDYYLGGVGAVVGVAAPMGVQSAPQSFQNGLQLLGKRIEYGSSAPTSGEWQEGDIIFNLAPTAGGTVGWVCTAAGPPSIWKTFGAIAT